MVNQTCNALDRLIPMFDLSSAGFDCAKKKVKTKTTTTPDQSIKVLKSK